MRIDEESLVQELQEVFAGACAELQVEPPPEDVRDAAIQQVAAVVIKKLDEGAEELGEIVRLDGPTQVKVFETGATMKRSIVAGGVAFLVCALFPPAAAKIPPLVGALSVGSTSVLKDVLTNLILAGGKELHPLSAALVSSIVSIQRAPERSDKNYKPSTEEIRDRANAAVAGMKLGRMTLADAKSRLFDLKTNEKIVATDDDGEHWYVTHRVMDNR